MPACAMEGVGWQLEVSEDLNIEGHSCQELRQAERLGSSLPDSLDRGQREKEDKLLGRKAF